MLEITDISRIIFELHLWVMFINEKLFSYYPVISSESLDLEMFQYWNLL
jgi:hypothetical protein